MKIYLVSYVGLSKDDDGNGYNECHAYIKEEDAKKKFKELRDNEIKECEDANGGAITYNIWEDEPDKFYMSWFYDEEAIKIYLHEVEMN